MTRRDDRQREVLRRRDHLVQHAVDAVAHLEFVFERLEVDVRRLVLDRLQQHEVEQTNNLVVFRSGGEFFKVDRLAAALQRLERVRVAEFSHHRRHRRAFPAVLLLEDAVDLLGRRDDGIDLEAHEQAKVIHRPEVVRVLHRNRDGLGALVELERNDLIGVRRFSGKGIECRLRNLIGGDLHHPHAGLPGGGGQHIVLGDVPHLHQDFAEALVLPLVLAGLLNAERLVHLIARDLAQFGEDATNATSFEFGRVDLAGAARRPAASRLFCACLRHALPLRPSVATVAHKTRHPKSVRTRQTACCLECTGFTRITNTK